MSIELVEATETLELETPSGKEGDSEARKKALVVRELPVNQWYKLQEAFFTMGDVLPYPSQATIMVVLELEEGKEDKILGFVVMQQVLHVEPLFIYPEGQGRNLHILLYDVVDHHVRVAKEALDTPRAFYFITLESETLIERALERGFKEIPGRIFGKEF